MKVHLLNTCKEVSRAALIVLEKALRGMQTVVSARLDGLKSYSGGSGMPMKRCEGGHYYDAAKHSVCPLCSSVQLERVQSVPVSKPTAVSADRIASQTVGIMLKGKAVDPVVGWLVCINGPDRGKDFRIRAEKNFIGRSSEMDIALTSDESVSRDKHASVVFNPKKNSFKIVPGDSRGLVHLNGEDIFQPEDLKRGDKIELGNTVLIFVPLCGDLHNWDEDTSVKPGSKQKTSAG